MRFYKYLPIQSLLYIKQQLQTSKNFWIISPAILTVKPDLYTDPKLGIYECISIIDKTKVP